MKRVRSCRGSLASAVLALLLLAGGAEAFFGICYCPACILRRHGIVPGTVRTDSGNEMLRCAQMAQQASDVRALLGTGKYELPMSGMGGEKGVAGFLSSLASKKGAPGRDEVDAGLENGDEREKAVFEAAKASVGPERAARLLGGRESGTSATGALVAASKALRERTDDEKEKVFDKTDAPASGSGIMGLLEKLGFGGGDMATVREIAVNLALFTEAKIEEMRLVSILEDAASREAEIRLEIARVFGSLYAEQAFIAIE